MKNSYDIVVIGAGHAGVEAALANARMGNKTLMVTLFFDTIGQMSCNPAIGGVGKGQLVKELDALGGEMGLAADRTGIQFRQLNSSKGQAVRSSRCQSDRKRYKLYMQEVVRHQKNLDVLEDKVAEVLVRNGSVIGIRTEKDITINAQAVVITTGTFLNGRIHVGREITAGGRVGEPNSTKLADNIKDLGFPVMMFKTGTPPRLDGKTIDFTGLEAQGSDDPPVPFSFRTPEIPKSQKLVPCHITRTNEFTHEIIKNNFHLSPMYSGQIQATGVRYCPSIEDKLKKFGDRDHHQIFLEPEGLDTDEYYPNGISTGLPADVQLEFVRTIKGLEKVQMVRPGYSIEHGVIPATELRPTLETKKVKGLYLAGQINGTTGYEEAASQGIIAGINAGLQVQNKVPFILGRHESYIGVLIDDLITKGTDEPYRMFTSRVEYRLIVREDNADKRLARYGHAFGLLSDEDFRKVEEKYKRIDEEIRHLRNTAIHPGGELDKKFQSMNFAPIRKSTTLGTILKRPEVNYEHIAEFDPSILRLHSGSNPERQSKGSISLRVDPESLDFARDGSRDGERSRTTSPTNKAGRVEWVDGALKDFPQNVIDQVEYELKYEGFIHRQMKDIEKFRHIENIRIPENIDYEKIASLSIEIRQKLKRHGPTTLGQANRISGVTPAAISILMIYLKKQSDERNEK